MLAAQNYAKNFSPNSPQFITPCPANEMSKFHHRELLGLEGAKILRFRKNLTKFLPNVPQDQKEETTDDLLQGRKENNFTLPDPADLGSDRLKKPHAFGRKIKGQYDEGQQD